MSDFATLSLITKFDFWPADKKRGLLYTIFRNINTILFRLHILIDAITVGRSADYNKKTDVRNVLLKYKVQSSTKIKNISKFCQKDIDDIKESGLDIILNFASVHLPGNLLEISKYGVWSYNSENSYVSIYKGIGYDEVVNKKETTDTVIQILQKDAQNKCIIHRSSMLTNYISISKNKNACYWRASASIIRIVQRLYEHGQTYLQELKCLYNTDKNEYDTTDLKSLDHALINMFIHFKNVSVRLFQKFFFVDYWYVVYLTNGKNLFSIPDWQEYTSLITPVDRFWADPFVISKGQKHYVFVEEFLYKDKKAHIAVIELNDRRKFLGARRVLQRPYHLSYPFLFEYNEDIYMIPETGANRTIELYKCSEFPDRWVFAKTIMNNVLAADSTLFFYNNKWWLFCCIDNTNRNIGMLDELYLFYSDDLFSESWKYHPKNPVQTTTRSARPAGKIFLNNGRIYRPSQDCSGRYGKQIHLNQIVSLSETDYKETIVSTIVPFPNGKAVGTHTFNFNNAITVMDMFTYKRRFRVWNKDLISATI